MHSTMPALPRQLAAPALVLDLDHLCTHLATIPDRRHARGRRYPLAALLTIAVLAKLAGYSQVREIAEWARLRQAELLPLFGLARPTLPHPSTWSRILAHALDPQALDTAIAAFFHQAASRPSASTGRHLSLDGKTLAGTIPLGQTSGVHLVSVYLSDQGRVLAQVAVPTKANELTTAPTLLAQVPLAGRVVTGDAMFTQRALSQQVVAAGGDYLWAVKKNQPALHEEIRWLFAPLRPEERASDLDFRQAQTVEKGHGRLEVRTLRASSLLRQSSTWPHLEQVFEVTSEVTDTQGKRTTAVRYGVTSLTAGHADAAALLRWVRRHWQQENGLHYRRDVTLGEDRSQVRMGQAPQVLASLNNLVIGLAVRHKQGNLAAWQRQLAYGFDKALHRGPQAVPNGS